MVLFGVKCFNFILDALNAAALSKVLKLVSALHNVFELFSKNILCKLKPINGAPVIL